MRENSALGLKDTPTNKHSQGRHCFQKRQTPISLMVNFLSFETEIGNHCP